MNLKRAIEIQAHHDDPALICSINEEREARRLLIEAGKRQRDFRIVWTKVMLCLLPGETPE